MLLRRKPDAAPRASKPKTSGVMRTPVSRVGNAFRTGAFLLLGGLTTGANCNNTEPADDDDDSAALECTDGDEDGFFSEDSDEGCEGEGGDCDDENPAVNPGEEEVCDYDEDGNPVDNDCDGAYSAPETLGTDCPDDGDDDDTVGDDDDTVGDDDDTVGDDDDTVGDDDDTVGDDDDTVGDDDDTVGDDDDTVGDDDDTVGDDDDTVGDDDDTVGDDDDTVGDDDDSTADDDDSAGDDDDSAGGPEVTPDDTTNDATQVAGALDALSGSPTTGLGNDLAQIPGGPVLLDTDGDGVDDAVALATAEVTPNTGSVAPTANTAPPATTTPTGATTGVNLYAGSGNPGLAAGFETTAGTDVEIGVPSGSSSELTVTQCPSSGDVNGDGNVDAADTPIAVAGAITAGNTPSTCTTHPVVTDGAVFVTTDTNGDTLYVAGEVN